MSRPDLRTWEAGEASSACQAQWPGGARPFRLDDAERLDEREERARVRRAGRAFADVLPVDLLAQRAGDPRWRIVPGRVLAFRGDYQRAEHLVREALELAEGTDFLYVQADAYDGLGEVLLLAGRTEEAAAAVERSAAIHEAKGNVVSAARLRQGGKPVGIA